MANLKVFNTLTRKKEEFKPLNPNKVGLYTCGPTVYNFVHLGNFRTYIFEDTLLRTLEALGYHVKHVRNSTDIDDKTIKASQGKYPNDEPFEALKKLTSFYETEFIKDTESLGIDFSKTKFVKATEHIKQMQEMIQNMPEAYLAEDGIYFDISEYVKNGYKYGALSEVTLDTHNKRQRIENQEYDKDEVHDFALWKKAKMGEPSWPFKWQQNDITGRPGWHIECSAMSTEYLGQPFDFHTGGVDLIFPHHENEIAQSVAANKKTFVNYFMHAEHLHVDGKKMAKSAGNFYTLKDLAEKGYNPLAFRMLSLQAHYRSQLNFTWESLEAASSFLQNLYAMADRQFQLSESNGTEELGSKLAEIKDKVLTALADDLNTSEALTYLAKLSDDMDKIVLSSANISEFKDFLTFIDSVFALGLTYRVEVPQETKDLIERRESLRKNGDFASADAIRQQLKQQGVHLNDTAHGTYWSRQ